MGPTIETLPPRLAISATEAARVNLLRHRGFDAQKKLLAAYHAAVTQTTLAVPILVVAASSQNMQVRNLAVLLLWALGGKARGFILSGTPLAVELAAIRRGPQKEIRTRLVKLLPKTEIHCHLDGSVREEKVLEHARRQGICLADDPGVKSFLGDIPRELDVSSLRRFMRIPAGGDASEFLKFLLGGFAIPLAVMQDAAALEDIAYDLIKQAHEDGVLHVDVRCAPCLHTEGGIEFYTEVGEAVMQGLLRGEREFGVSSSLVLCVYRDKIDTDLYGEKYAWHPMPTATAAVRLARRYPWRVALDLVGYEAPAYPPELYGRAFKGTFHTPVWRTVHAGESPESARNILTAVRDLQAHRIGHGIHVLDLSLAEQREIRRLGIVFEVCPWSNAHIGVIGAGSRDIAEHPLIRMHEAGFRVTISTDNRTVSDISLSGQLEQAADSLGLRLFTPDGVSDMLRSMLANAASAAFAPAERRTVLERELDQNFLVVNHLVKILCARGFQA
ncbi:MAG: hypothetical protein NT099_02800 [Candidatus Saganbacteria bacterium]|nr:hypothetical protein [Candidatus Saganbacteria bacterium]